MQAGVMPGDIWRTQLLGLSCMHAFRAPKRPATIQGTSNPCRGWYQLYEGLLTPAEDSVRPVTSLDFDKAQIQFLEQTSLTQAITIYAAI